MQAIARLNESSDSLHSLYSSRIRARQDRVSLLLVADLCKNSSAPAQRDQEKFQICELRVSLLVDSKYTSCNLNVTRNCLFFLDCRSIKDSSAERCESNEGYKARFLTERRRSVWEINTWCARSGGKILSTFNCAMFTSWPVIILFGTRRL